MMPFPLFGIDGVFFANRPASNTSGATPNLAGLAAVPLTVLLRAKPAEVRDFLAGTSTS